MSPDALHSIASKVEHDWGSYGYRFEKITPAGFGGAVGEVWHSDGSVFYVGSDRYGNTCHGDTLALVVAALAAMAQVSA